MAFEIQHVGEDRIYTVQWSSWMDSGDSISSNSWIISPTGPTVTDLGDDGGTKTSAKVSGLTKGVLYRLTGQIVTANGETAKQSTAVRAW